MQAVTPQACQLLARRFASLLAKLRRRFRAVPIYIGHPDDAAFAGQPGHSDTRVYGHVLEVQARADGLWVLPAFGPAGHELIQTRRYRFFSPRWTVRPLAHEASQGGQVLGPRGNGAAQPYAGAGADGVQYGGQRGLWEPVELLSLGLTNMPNIPGQVLCNVAAPQGSDGPAQLCLLKTASTALPALQEAWGHRVAFQDCVQKRMRRLGKDYLSAWSELKSQRSFPSLQGFRPYENGHKTIKT
jgi:hypothetical protein